MGLLDYLWKKGGWVEMDGSGKIKFVKKIILTLEMEAR